MSEVEEVLVFNESLLYETLPGWAEKGGILAGRDAVEAIQTICRPENLFFMERPYAENDPTFKQVIPYVIIMRGNEVFRYQRTKKGGESRLHDRWSIGVGGHINPQDSVISADGDVLPAQTVYETAMWRELQEEVSVEREGREREAFSLPPVALLYDPSDEVGRVHFGIVHILQVGFQRKLEFRDPALANGHFMGKGDLKNSPDNFEAWSRMVIDNVL